MALANRKELLSRATVAWPTLALLIAVLATFSLATGAAAAGLIDWRVGLVVNVAAAFAAFTPMHDASHRAVAKTGWVNAIVGRVAALLLAAPFTAFRYMHLEHHKHTNDAERDPDFWSGDGPRWQLPLRWLTQDIHYYVVYVREFRQRPQRERVETVVTFALVYATAIVGIAMGAWWQVICLWLIPARIATGLLAFSFDYLPHRPHTITSRQDRYRATRIFTDAWLTPLFLFQNYHLVHHLFPEVPFYRYRRVWDALAPELERKGAVATRLISWGADRPGSRAGIHGALGSRSTASSTGPGRACGVHAGTPDFGQPG